MEYEIEIVDINGRDIPMLFNYDSDKALLGEMLLTERSFIKEIVDLLADGLEGKNSRCSFNVFTLSVQPKLTVIRDDYRSRRLALDTESFYEAAKDYMNTLLDIKRKEKARAADPAADKPQSKKSD